MEGGSVDLVAQTKELVAIASVSRDETEIADYIWAQLRANAGFVTTRVANNIIAVVPGYDPAHGVVIAGHLDTVPPSLATLAAEGPDEVIGVGAVDMKGGLAVMLALAASRPTQSVKLVFYACEEISRSHSGLLEIERADPGLLEGSAAIVMEPTGGWIEAGCQGTAKFRVTVGGRRAHTARPWMGSNAIHRAHGVLAWLSSYEPAEYSIDGCRYREALSAVSIAGGIAGNVVPEVLSLDINYRFAPRGRDQEALKELSAQLEALIDASSGDAVELIEWAPSAPPSLSNPTIATLVGLAKGQVRAKLGWTDVAFFSERAIPACNFGPGDPLMAHSELEVVTRAELDEVAEAILALFATS